VADSGSKVDLSGSISLLLQGCACIKTITLNQSLPGAKGMRTSMFRKKEAFHIIFLGLNDFTFG
jgi:hypothetical protein